VACYRRVGATSTCRRLRAFGKSSPRLWERIAFEGWEWPGQIAIWLATKRDLVRVVDLTAMSPLGNACLLGALAGGAVEELTLQLDQIKQDFHTTVLCLPRLRELTISLSPGYENYVSWGGKLHGCGIGFTHLPQLTSLRLRYCEPAKVGTLKLAEMPQLREFELRTWDLGHDHPVLTSELAGLGSLTALTSLTLSLGDLYEHEADTKVPALPQLRVLNLTKTHRSLEPEMSVAGPLAVSCEWERLTQLSALSLSECRLTEVPEAVLCLPKLQVRPCCSQLGSHASPAGEEAAA
jgi:hypothetical protein